jgi:tRNA uridine 5-carboxymethylaminomethyl modification enzyme
MFTSRAEYRLLLRHDNADLRLTPRAAAIGLVDAHRTAKVDSRLAELARAEKFIRKTTHAGVKLDHWFRILDHTWENLPAELRAEFHVELWPEIETRFKYEGHLQRQQRQVDKLARQEAKAIPAWVDYLNIKGLKLEARQKFDRVRPATLGQAGRISGITPADVTFLAIFIENGGAKKPVAAGDES